MGGDGLSNKSRGQRAETALRAILQERGYLVIRSAASKVYDLVCADEGGFVFFIEVKSVKGSTFRVSRTEMTKEQHAQMQRDYDRYGSDDVYFIYAVRFPDGEYRIFGCESEIMPQDGGVSLDVAFPMRITPNNPPIVPRGSDARIVLNEGDKDTRGSWYVAPDGDTSDAQC